MRSTHQKTWALLVLTGQFLFSTISGSSMATTPSVDAVVSGNNNFAIDLYLALSQDDGNLFFSPLSISTALSMTYVGAKNTTAAEMQKVLHLPASEKALHEGNRVLHQLLEDNLVGGSQMDLANSLWPDRSEKLLDSFVQSLKENFGAEARALDFENNPDQAAVAINKWVAEKTKGRIVDLLQPGDITVLTRLVLTNAIVFDGKWEQAFDPEKTRSMSFHLPDGGEVRVPGMVRKADYKFAQMDGFSLLELPFTGETTSLLIAMPQDVGGLGDLGRQLDPAVISKWSAEMHPVEFQLTMPRFELESRVDLSNVLTRLGMPEAFTSEADFSGISGTKGLFISKVLHQATLKLHEEGAEAAAATAVIMERLSESREFRIDRPFLFMIRHDETGSILFMGRMMNPGGS